MRITSLLQENRHRCCCTQLSILRYICMLTLLPEIGSNTGIRIIENCFLRVAQRRTFRLGHLIEMIEGMVMIAVRCGCLVWVLRRTWRFLCFRCGGRISVRACAFPLTRVDRGKAV